MAFEIRIRGGKTTVPAVDDNSDPLNVRLALVRNLQKSRFDASVHDRPPKRTERADGVTAVVTLHEIRLRESKPYCGNHPAECQDQGHRRKAFGGGKTKFLEGADWIGFNDLVNDTLDALGVDADAGSFIQIRRGRRRRIRYEYHQRGGVRNEWDREGLDRHYEDFCGKPAPDTIFPKGTPGLAKWRAEEDVSVPA